MISTQALIDKFKQALSEKWGYIWGMAGEQWTAGKQKELEKTTDSDRAQGRAYGSRWIGHRVADCSGLFSWAFKQLGGYMYHGSDTMYRKYCVNKGELKKGKRTDCATLKPGTAVFVWNGKKYSHVGLYIGGDTVIEAMGTMNGVTTSKVTAGKWTHWGELQGVDYAGAGDPGSGTAGNESQGSFLNGSSPMSRGDGTPVTQTLKRGSKGSAVAGLQTMLRKLGYDLGPCGIDGDFGKTTEAAVRSFQSDHRLAVDGVAGKNTWAELEKAVKAISVKPGEETYSVTIGGLDLTQAQALMNNYPGSVMEKE